MARRGVPVGSASGAGGRPAVGGQSGLPPSTSAPGGAPDDGLHPGKGSDLAVNRYRMFVRGGLAARDVLGLGDSGGDRPDLARPRRSTPYLRRRTPAGGGSRRDPARAVRRLVRRRRGVGARRPRRAQRDGARRRSAPTATRRRAPCCSRASTRAASRSTATSSRARAATSPRTRARRCVFPWHPMMRQVVVVGDVERVADAEAGRYFISRPYGSRLGPLGERAVHGHRVARGAQGAVRRAGGGLPGHRERGRRPAPRRLGRLPRPARARSSSGRGGRRGCTTGSASCGSATDAHGSTTRPPGRSSGSRRNPGRALGSLLA